MKLLCWLSNQKVTIAAMVVALCSLSLIHPVAQAASNQSISDQSMSDHSIANSEDEVFGPENLMKTLPTPFTTGVRGEEESSSSSSGAMALSPIAISSSRVISKRSALAERMHGPKLYLPARMSLGLCSEFIVKGNPGSYVAIAMADNNTGSKPVYGHNLRLGPDRKLMAVGKIPGEGIVSLFIEMPIQGDLVGAPVYFEAAVWSKPDFSDLQIASAISTQENRDDNGVIVAGQQEAKKDRAVTLQIPEPMSSKTVGGLSSGKP